MSEEQREKTELEIFAEEIREIAQAKDPGRSIVEVIAACNKKLPPLIPSKPAVELPPLEKAESAIDPHIGDPEPETETDGEVGPQTEGA